MQSLSANNSVDALTALAQLTALSNPAFTMPSQSVSNSTNQSTVNALSQHSTPQAHWKPTQSNVQAMYMQQMYGYQNSGYNNGGVKKQSDPNGNNDGVNQRDDKIIKNVRDPPPKNFKRQSTTNATVPKESSVIRPRTQTQRREAGKIINLIEADADERNFILNEILFCFYSA